MYPAADVPVLQLSLNLIQGPEFHFALGEKLKYLRREGILIIGSGNIVHNLRRIDFSDNARPLDWAVEFDAWVKQRLEDGNYKAIVHDARDTEAGKLSIPTPEHWYPLLYTLGAADDGEHLRFEYEGIDNASISMRCLSLGA
jgi:4,5-DOPA dioxygenase extradiol